MKRFLAFALCTVLFVLVLTSCSSSNTTTSSTVGTSAPKSAVVTLAIGNDYQGGKIAYIDDSGQHGLIAAPSDQSTGIRWYNGRNTATGAIATAIGTGNANTNTIIENQGAGSYAAQLCADLVLGGYSDWYLPSKDELNQLYLNKTAVGGFANANYWSSSEFSNYFARLQDFHYNFQGANNKALTYHVRAVRAF
jgi:hypothetical protein